MSDPQVRPTDIPDFLTVRQVARKLTLSEQTVYSLIARGKLTAHRFGDRSARLAISPVDLADFLARTALARMVERPEPSPTRAARSTWDGPPDLLRPIRERD